MTAMKDETTTPGGTFVIATTRGRLIQMTTKLVAPLFVAGAALAAALALAPSAAASELDCEQAGTTSVCQRPGHSSIIATPGEVGQSNPLASLGAGSVPSIWAVG